MRVSLSAVQSELDSPSVVVQFRQRVNGSEEGHSETSIDTPKDDDSNLNDGTSSANSHPFFSPNTGAKLIPKVLPIYVVHQPGTV